MQKYHVSVSLAVLLVMVLICASISRAQPTDTMVGTDKVYLRDGSILEGSVKVIKTEIVEFVELETNLTYELEKTEIKLILLASGKSITFPDGPTPMEAAQQAAQPQVIEKDGGAPVGLVILASVGVMFVLLLLIGAAAS